LKFIKRMVTDILTNFTVNDIFDFIIIYFLIYFVLLWFRKASSRFLLIGLGFFTILYTCALSFHLYLTALVLKSFFAIILIAMVVIFQEDIRRFIERMAVIGLFQSRYKQLSSITDIEVLISTAAKFARKSIGAIMVIKGKDPLDRHLRGGTLLDGKVSEPLLESIFDTHSNGHDGAVLVEEGRIVKFGCHLPLSTNYHKIEKKGTRHAAALGLAERTDALSIVVSEERGVISVAHDENIRELKSADQLRTVVRRFYEIELEASRKKSLKERLTRNFREKTVALILSTVLWVVFGYFGYHQDKVKKDITVPISYKNLPSELFVQSPKSEKVTVVLEGSERAFFLLKPEELQLSIDMSSAVVGQQKVVIDKEDLTYPSNISVIAFKPEALTVNVIKMVKAELPIVVPVIGNPPGDLALKKAQVKPSSITALIPEYMDVEKLQIKTEDLDLSLIDKTKTVVRKLEFPESIHIVEGQPREVEITIELRKKNTIRPELDNTPEDIQNNNRQREH
jgi:diadenylate cyclase